MQKKIAIILPGYLPVPALAGGAIETLVDGLISVNEQLKSINITVFSAYHKQAVVQSAPYHFTQFYWIKYTWINKIVNFATRIYAKFSRNPIPHYGLLQVLQKLKDEQYDLVIVEGNDQQIEPIAKVIGKDKVYFHLHANLFASPSHYEHCKTVISISNFVTRQILLYTKKKQDEIIILPNCVDIFRFEVIDKKQKREACRNKYQISDEDVVICFVGRIVEEKGIKELMEALLLLPQNISFKLLIVGSSGSSFGFSNGTTHFFEEVRTLAKQLKSKVLFTGFIPNTEMDNILAAADVSVVPSVYEEPAGLVVIEAMAAGLPLVITKSGGMPEYVTEECAVVIPIDADLITNLSVAIKKLIESPEQRKKMGAAGVINAQQYGFNSYYANFLKIIEKD